MHGCKIYDCKAKACLQCFLGVSIMQLEAEGISQDLLNNSKSMSASQNRGPKQHPFFPIHQEYMYISFVTNSVSLNSCAHIFRVRCYTV